MNNVGAQSRIFLLVMILCVISASLSAKEELSFRISAQQGKPSGKTASNIVAPEQIRNSRIVAGLSAFSMIATEYQVGLIEDGNTRQIQNAPELYSTVVSSVVFVATPRSLGAGIFVKDNIVITNYHVIKGNDKAACFLYDRNITSARNIDLDKAIIGNVIACDKNRDLALIKVESNKNSYHSAKFGNPYSIRIAQDVFAIGHPLGHLWSFTYGVISALPSPYEWTYLDGTEHRANCIQTQTPINPGNSGGPLFSKEGLLIGINSMGIEADGLNFAVKIDEISDFLTEASSGKHQDCASLETEIEWDEIVDHGLKDVTSVWAADTDKNGYYDSWAVYKDADDKIDIYLFDTTGDKIPELMYVVAEDTWYTDDNQDGVLDRKGWDTNNDGIPDRFEAL